MSWSFYGIGKPEAVARKAREDMARQKCHEPEESIKSMALDLIETSLMAMPASSAVHVQASGSQSKNDNGAVNTFNLKIDPVYGFVE